MLQLTVFWPIRNLRSQPISFKIHDVMLATDLFLAPPVASGRKSEENTDVDIKFIMFTSEIN